MRALPVMVDNGGGAIVSTTSSAGAVNGLAVYGAAKAGVNSLMRSIAIEYGKLGIRANAIAPSAASPGMLSWQETLPGGVAGFEAKQPMGRVGRLDEIADVASYLASDYASFINGVVLPVDGGIEAMLATPMWHHDIGPGFGARPRRAGCVLLCAMLYILSITSIWSRGRRLKAAWFGVYT